MIAAWLEGIQDRLNRRYSSSDTWPRGGSENDESEATTLEVLLIAKVLIRRDQHIVPCALNDIKQGAVRQGRPSLSS